MFYGAWMDRDFAIERHRVPLLGFVLELFAMIGLTEGGTVERLSRPLYRLVLGILRPAESAVRRLIIVAARDIVVEPAPKRAFPAGRVISRKGQGKHKRGASFKLFDPRKDFDGGKGRRHKGPRVEPRIHVFDFDPRIPLFLRAQPAAPAPAPTPAPEKDDTVNAGPLCRRLVALMRALEDLQGQAKRLARWRARPVAERRPHLTSPIRVGRPPGFRKRQTHEVDEILMECHWLARNVPALRLRRVAAQEQAALAAGAHRHVAVDQEGQAAEHLLLGQAGLPGHRVTDPVREPLVVRHDGSIARPTATRPGPAG